jgi:hypothetical protein
MVLALAALTQPALAQQAEPQSGSEIAVLRGSADVAASSRIGHPPVYGDPAAFGAGSTGFDSLNRRRKLRRAYPGTPRPLSQAQIAQQTAPNPATPTVIPPPPRFANPQTASRTPIAPSLAGLVPGQPTRRPLKPDTDPFGAVGDYVGGFLVKSAIEVSGGYDSNPGRFTSPRGSAFMVVAPELVAASDWSRHSLVVDLRGSFTGYDKQFAAQDPTTSTFSPVPYIIDRPDFTGRVDGRLDVTRDTRIVGQARLRVATDNPGSPNIQAGLLRYPLYTGVGGTIGAEQDFNRLTLAANATVDRLGYQDSRLTNGVSAPNTDRNFDQAGGLVRASYEMMPGLKPFAEAGGDTRRHDTEVDRNGYARDSSSNYFKAGSTFELTRLISGEFAVGYGQRSYRDPRLNDLKGLLTSGSLVWAVTPLTTFKVSTATSLDETVLAGASGVLVRTYTAEIDHDFRRWLTGIGRFTYGTLDYQGGNRLDKFYSASFDLIYRLSRTWQIKAQIRHDRLAYSRGVAESASTAGMLGVRWQN